MTTPATFGTPFALIRDAMIEAGYLGIGREPKSEHFAMYTNKLNYLFNFLQTRPGLKLWLNQDLPIPLVAGQNLYSLGPSAAVPMTKPIRAFEGYYIDGFQSATRRPLIPIGRSEWDMLSTTVQQGTVTSFFVDKQQLALNVYTWLTPDLQAALGTLHLIVTQQVAGIVSLTDTINFPIEWYLTIMWQLAAQICTGQPQAVVDRCQQMAQYHLEVLEDWDVEDASTTFTVDSRVYSGLRRFR